jgi:N-acetylmuramoyl-L-alanine amidase
MINLLVLSLAVTLASPTPAEVFVDAKQAYAAIKADKARRGQRTSYDKLVKQLVAASRQKGARADECAYFAATVAEDLANQSGVAADLDTAIDLNVTVADAFKASSLADDALLRAARLRMGRKGDLDGARALLQRARKEQPNGDQAKAVIELLGRLPPEPAPEKAVARRAEKKDVEKREVAEKVEKPSRSHVDKADKPAAMEEDTASKDRLQDILDKFAQAQRDGGLPVTLDVATTNNLTAHDHDEDQLPPPPPSGPALPVKSIHVDAKGPATVVSMQVEGAVTLNTGVAPAQGPMPPRFYVDIAPVLSGPTHKALKAYKDARVLGARAAQFDARTVRVVFELKGDVPGNAVYDAARKRVVITLGKEAPPPPPAMAQATQPPAPPLEPTEQPSIDDGTPVARVAAKVDAGPTLSEVKGLADDFKGRSSVSLSAQTGLKVKRVVIDAGHGGDDPGAIGPSGVKEKDVTLKIARKVAERLKKELKMEVILTRDKDVFIPLEERTAIANAAHADLFISIHCNSNPNRRIYGVESYYLNITDDNYAIRLAARENRTSERSISDLQFILADLAMKSNVDDSVRLSKMVQANVVGELRDNYTQVKDLGVKHALFYVLIGAKMPAILVETSFVSNKMEEQRLNSVKYQDRIADGLVQGVRNFVEERQALAR